LSAKAASCFYAKTWQRFPRFPIFKFREINYKLICIISVFLKVFFIPKSDWEKPCGEAQSTMRIAHLQATLAILKVGGK